MIKWLRPYLNSNSRMASLERRHKILNKRFKSQGRDLQKTKAELLEKITNAEELVDQARQLERDTRTQLEVARSEVEILKKTTDSMAAQLEAITQRFKTFTAIEVTRQVNLTPSGRE